MRKLIGGFLGLLAVLFLGFAYAQLAHAEEPDCDSALAKKIAELEEQDKSGILEKQTAITTLKLASQTVGSGNKTVEDYIRKQEDLLRKLNEESDKADGTADNTGILERLVGLYQASGASGGDRDQALARIKETLVKLPKASYWKKETRFKNHELGAFVTAHALIHGGESPYREADAAILWLNSEISEGLEKATHRGSAPANLSEVSSMVVRFTGVIENSYTAESLQKAMAAAQKSLDEEIEKMVSTYRADLAKSCAELQTCSDCKVTDAHRESALVKAIAEMKKKYVADPKLKDKRVQALILKEAKERKLEPARVSATESEDSPKPSHVSSLHPAPSAPAESAAPPAPSTPEKVPAVTPPVVPAAPASSTSNKPTPAKPAVPTGGVRAPAVTSDKPSDVNLYDDG